MENGHPNGPAVRVLLVEDFVPFRRFLRSALVKYGGLQIVGEASDGLEAVRQVEELQPDIILLDIGLPTLNGIQAARRIRNLSPRSKIIFVSAESSADIVGECLRIGGAAYVAKTRAVCDLPVAVSAVLEGRRFLSSGCTWGAGLPKKAAICPYPLNI
jgi:DNA-binding NarL/FixJ family response regulator